MPCTDERANYDGYNSLKEEFKQKIDILTQDLCYLCANLKESNLLETYASERILKWHKEHMDDDEARVSRIIEEEYNKNINLLETPSFLAKKLIKKAEKVHPVSNFHKRWFENLTKEIAKNMIEEKKLYDNKLSEIKKKITKEELEFLKKELKNNVPI